MPEFVMLNRINQCFKKLPLATRGLVEPTLALLCASSFAVSAQASSPKVPESAKATASAIYQMQPRQLDRYLQELFLNEASLTKRIEQIARRNLGQPYKLNLLGEFPYQIHDELPLYSLSASDCVVFIEHTYAMALSKNWDQFFWTLQRIRYRDGVIGVATRNHYMEVDWHPANNWLMHEVTDTLAPGQLGYYEMQVDRAAFLARQHGVKVQRPVENSRQAYLPVTVFLANLSKLQSGDLIEVVTQLPEQTMVTHTALALADADGRIQMVHASAPQVREESFASFIQRTQERQAKSAKQRLLGFKVLRLRERIQFPPMLAPSRPD